MNLMCEIWSRKPQMLRIVARWHPYKTSCSRCVFMAWLTYREVLVVESQAARPTSWQTQFESVFSTCLCVKPLDVFRPRHKTRCPDVFLILTMWLLWLNRNTASWQKKHWRFKQKRNTEVRLICGSPGSDFANMYSGHRCLALIRVVQQSAEPKSYLTTNSCLEELLCTLSYQTGGVGDLIRLCLCLLDMQTLGKHFFIQPNYSLQAEVSLLSPECPSPPGCAPPPPCLLDKTGGVKPPSFKWIPICIPMCR